MVRGMIHEMVPVGVFFFCLPGFSCLYAELWPSLKPCQGWVVGGQSGQPPALFFLGLFYAMQVQVKLFTLFFSALVSCSFDDRCVLGFSTNTIYVCEENERSFFYGFFGIFFLPAIVLLRCSATNQGGTYSSVSYPRPTNKTSWFLCRMGGGHMLNMDETHTKLTLS